MNMKEEELLRQDDSPANIDVVTALSSRDQVVGMEPADAALFSVHDQFAESWAAAPSTIGAGRR